MPVDALLHSLTEHRAAFAKARGLYARRLAPDFNVFDFIAPDELRLSAILAWLLDPAGSHSQGTLFLVEFLRELGLPWADEGLDEARVAVEVSIDGRRRIDVLVQWPGAMLAIENKPFAADQPGQIEAYLTWLDVQAPQGRRCLVYLSAVDEALPSDASITEEDRLARYEAGELQLWSYGQLLPWLTRARGGSMAESVRSFLDAFVHYIRRRFMGVRDVTERQQLVEVVRRTPENLRSALQVLAAADDIRGALLAGLAEQLRARLPAGFSLVRADASASRYTGFGISLPDVNGLHFTVEFEGTNFHWLIYGVSRSGGGDVAPDTQAHLDAVFGRGTQTAQWPWYRQAAPREQCFPVEGDWRASEQAWVDIENGILAGRIVAAAEAFHRVLVLPTP